MGLLSSHTTRFILVHGKMPDIIPHMDFSRDRREHSGYYAMEVVCTMQIAATAKIMRPKLLSLGTPFRLFDIFRPDRA